jgi:hypothetical protein
VPDGSTNFEGSCALRPSGGNADRREWWVASATYNSGGEPPEMTTVRSPAAAGYCRLRTYDPKATVDPSNMWSIPNEDPSVFCIGSPCTPNMTPSLFEAYYTTEKEVQIILEHQMGHAPDKIYLRVYIEKSKWHVFARIAIRQI